MVQPAQFTERELDVMSILWREGSGTVAEVRDELPMELGYTGVLKVLQILETKGLVSHTKEGRAYRYRATTRPETAGIRAMTRIVEKIFHGSTERALVGMLAERELDADEVERMKEILDRATRRSSLSEAAPESP